MTLLEGKTFRKVQASDGSQKYKSGAGAEYDDYFQNNYNNKFFNLQMAIYSS